MNSELQKRLYEMEVSPPEAVWVRLSQNIDEINTDNAVAKKILNAELTPPAVAWEKINAVINVVEEKLPEKKATVINLRRLAVAAVFIGLVISAWLLLRGTNERTNELAGGTKAVEEITTPDTNTIEKKSELVKENNLPETTSIVAVNAGPVTPKNKKNKSAVTKGNKTLATTELVNTELTVLNNETPGVKSFDQPIDDLSLITADEHYMTMVNANGRLVKIPVQLAHLAPHLQDKPVSEDIYEVMFGEGAYWKETLNEWRKKIISLPVSSGDAFTSFIELLKTIQDK